jgi:hypothetical protein
VQGDACDIVGIQLIDGGLLVFERHEACLVELAWLEVRFEGRAGRQKLDED